VNTRQISFCAITDLSPHPDNARKHTRAQVRAIAKSIESFEFTAPILIDAKRRILAGHGRWQASRLVGLSHVPIIFLDHLTEAQAKAYKRLELPGREQLRSQGHQKGVGVSSNG
jgi:ParB-like chromosome segregation protein Spo0J